METAFAEGKVIQIKCNHPNDAFNREWRDNANPIWMEELEYRIKPEPKLRPFTQEEAIRFRLFKHKDTSDHWDIPDFFTPDSISINGYVMPYMQLLVSMGYCSTGIPNSKGELEWQRCGIEVNE